MADNSTQTSLLRGCDFRRRNDGRRMAHRLLSQRAKSRSMRGSRRNGKSLRRPVQVLGFAFKSGGDADVVISIVSDDAASREIWLGSE